MPCLGSEDYLSIHNLELPNQLKDRILKAASHDSSPWELGDKTLFQGVVELVEAWDEVVGPDADLKRDEVISSLCSRKRPLNSLIAIVAGSRDKKDTVSKVDESSTSSSTATPYDDEKRMYIEAIEEALTHYTECDPTERKTIARHFFAISRRGGATLPEILTELTSHNRALTPQAVADVLLKLREDLRLPVVDNKPGVAAEQSEGTESDQRDISITTKMTKGFHDWLKDLGQDDIGRVNRRLFRIQAGALGDYHPVKLENDLFEFRFLSSGIRLIFAFRGENEVILLHGFKKDGKRTDHARENRIARERLDQHRQLS